MDNIKISVSQLDKMKHTIGFRNDRIKGRKNRKYKAFRNYFTTGSECDNFNELNELVDLNLMSRRIDRFNENGYIFHVTEYGFEYLSSVLDIKITEMD